MKTLIYLKLTISLLKKNIILILLPFLVNSCNDIDFDSKKWRNWNYNENDWSMRWDMSEDLINNYKLEGKDTNEIFNLLGKTELDCFKNECYARYPLGPCRTGINEGTLELTIKNGKVSEISKRCN
jgi:hypothetical protein